jgi:hypothetical protein
MSKHAQWFDILVVARGFEDFFTGSQLAKSAGLSDTEKSKASQIAAAWLRKFEKWGYVERGAAIDSNGPRKALTWKVSEKGAACQLQDSLESRFTRLLTSFREYQEAMSQGTKEETAAFKKLCEIADKVDPSKAEDEE